MKKKELKKRIKELEEDIRCFRSSDFNDNLSVQIKYDMIDRIDKLILGDDLTKECNANGFLPLMSVYEKTN